MLTRCCWLWRNFLDELLGTLARLAIFLIGIYIIAAVLIAAIRTFVLPRAASVRITTVVFRTVRWFFQQRGRRITTYEERDELMAMFAPVALLALPVAWTALIICGYALIFFALGVGSLYESFSLAGSSVLTLGFTKSDTFITLMFEFGAATLGLTMVALLIAYLPTMYSAFSKRETLVTLLETRAGSPPSAVEFLLRAKRIDDLNLVNEIWPEWTIWFAEIDETHTSLVALVFFRSPRRHARNAHG